MRIVQLTIFISTAIAVVVPRTIEHSGDHDSYQIANSICPHSNTNCQPESLAEKPTTILHSLKPEPSTSQRIYDESKKHPDSIDVNAVGDGDGDNLQVNEKDNGDNVSKAPEDDNIADGTVCTHDYGGNVEREGKHHAAAGTEDQGDADHAGDVHTGHDENKGHNSVEASDHEDNNDGGEEEDDEDDEDDEVDEYEDDDFSYNKDNDYEDYFKYGGYGGLGWNGIDEGYPWLFGYGGNLGHEVLGGYEDYGGYSDHVSDYGGLIYGR